MSSIELGTVRERIVKHNEARVTNCIDRVQAAWRLLGLPDAEARQETDAFVAEQNAHMDDLWERFAKTQEERESSARQTVEQGLIEYAALQQQLGNLAQPTLSLPDSMTLRQREQRVTLKIEALRQERSKRIEKLAELQNAEEEMFQRMVDVELFNQARLTFMTPAVALADVPSELLLKEFEQHLTMMRQEFEKRREKYAQICVRLRQLIVKLELSSDHCDLALHRINNDESTFVLSKSNLLDCDKKLQELEEERGNNLAEAKSLDGDIKSLRHRLDESGVDTAPLVDVKFGSRPSELVGMRAELERLRQLKAINMERFIKATRVDIDDLWRKCYIGDGRLGFPQFDSRLCLLLKVGIFFNFVFEFKTGSYTDESLAAHEEKLKSVERFYEAHKNVFSKVSELEAVFEGHLTAQVGFGICLHT